MFAGEALRRRQHDTVDARSKPIEELSYPASLLVGVAQSLALLPGISRSGISMVAGLLCDLDHEQAARLFVPARDAGDSRGGVARNAEALRAGGAPRAARSDRGGIAAGVAAYCSVAFLTRYFRSNDLRPFGWYCVVVGAICSLLARRGVIT